MQQKKDITGLDDIKQLVAVFYEKIRKDTLIGPIFNGIIQDDWEVHLDKMNRFWQTVLLEEHTYYGSPFPPHTKMPVNAIHFERWMQLFKPTVHELFEGPKAGEAIWRAEKMALLFQAKLAHYQEQGFKNLL